MAMKPRSVKFRFFSTKGSLPKKNLNQLQKNFLKGVTLYSHTRRGIRRPCVSLSGFSCRRQRDSIVVGSKAATREGLYHRTQQTRQKVSAASTLKFYDMNPSSGTSLINYTRSSTNGKFMSRRW